MKSLFALFALLFLVHCQHPVPLPDFDSKIFDGEWYLTWYYSAGINNKEPNPVTCVKFEISTNDVGGDLNETYYQNGTVYYANFTFDEGAVSSIWLYEGKELVWIAADPIDKAWAVGGYLKQQTAMIISRNPNISKVVSKGQVLLLKQEGYSINETNFLVYENQVCS